MKFVIILLLALSFNLNAQVVLQGIPVSAVMSFDSESCPTGWLPRDGSCVSKTTYAKLYQAIGSRYEGTFGACAQGFFRLADARGLFGRNAGTNATLSASNGTKYTGSSVGSYLNVTDIPFKTIQRNTLSQLGSWTNSTTFTAFRKVQVDLAATAIWTVASQNSLVIYRNGVRDDKWSTNNNTLMPTINKTLTLEPNESFTIRTDGNKTLSIDPGHRININLVSVSEGVINQTDDEIEVIRINQAQNAMLKISTGDLRFNLATASFNKNSDNTTLANLNSKFIGVEDDATNTRTVFRAKQDISLDISVRGLTSGAGTAIYAMKNATENSGLSTDSAGNGYAVALSAPIFLKANEFVTIYTTAALVSSGGGCFVSLKATPASSRKTVVMPFGKEDELQALEVYGNYGGAIAANADIPFVGKYKENGIKMISQTVFECGETGWHQLGGTVGCNFPSSGYLLLNVAGSTSRRIGQISSTYAITEIRGLVYLVKGQQFSIKPNVAGTLMIGDTDHVLTICRLNGKTDRVHTGDLQLKWEYDIKSISSCANTTIKWADAAVEKLANGLYEVDIRAEVTTTTAISSLGFAIQGLLCHATKSYAANIVPNFSGYAPYAPMSGLFANNSNQLYAAVVSGTIASGTTLIIYCKMIAPTKPTFAVNTL